jgi:cyclase
MLKPRLIVSLLIDQQRNLVKTEMFRFRRYLGDPLNAVHIFSYYNVDELLLLFIDAGCKETKIPTAYMQLLASHARMPLVLGGGICSLKQIESVLKLGCERVVLSGALANDQKFLGAAVNAFGSSSVSVLINAKRCSGGDVIGYLGWGPRAKGFQIKTLVSNLANEGAGEIIVYDSDRDGTFLGFDTKLICYLNEGLTVPLVALGGCSSVNDAKSLCNLTTMGGVAAGSIFCFAPGSREVLLNYPSSASSSYLTKK